MFKSRLLKLALIIFVFSLAFNANAFAKGGESVNFTGSIKDIGFPADSAGNPGWAVGISTDNKGKILKQSSVGGNWTVFKDTKDDLFTSIVMVDANFGVAVGYKGNDGRIYEWNGSQWNKVSQPSGTKKLNRVAKQPNGYIYIDGNDGNVLVRWTDNEWHHFGPTTTRDLYGCEVVASGSTWDGYAVGEDASSVYRFYNGVWSLVPTGLPSGLTLVDLYLTSVGNGAAVASNGTVIQIVNGVWSIVPGLTITNAKAVIDVSGGQAFGPQNPIRTAGSGNNLATFATNGWIAPMQVTTTTASLLILFNDATTGDGQVAVMDRNGGWFIDSISQEPMNYWREVTDGNIWAVGDGGTIVVMDRNGGWFID